MKCMLLKICNGRVIKMDWFKLFVDVNNLFIIQKNLKTINSTLLGFNIGPTFSKLSKHSGLKLLLHLFYNKLPQIY